MARKKYILFVDEVKPTPPFSVYNFTGVAILFDKYDLLKTQMDTIKNNCISRFGGEKVNLHFTDLKSKRNEFSKITKTEEELLWKELISLFKRTDFKILAGIVNGEKLNEYYSHYRVNQEILAFKILLENFVRFLHLNNGYGHIIIESSNDDEKIREEFYRGKLMGGKYITINGYTEVLRGIEFKGKNDLSQGLQLVDFIANPISRFVSEMPQYKDIELDYSGLLENKIFDGNINNRDEYGVKKIFL